MDMHFSAFSGLHPISGGATSRLRLDLFGVVERLLDFLGVFCALFVAERLTQTLDSHRYMDYSHPMALLAAATFAIFTVLLLERHGEYRPYVSLLWVRETERLLRVTLQSFVAASLAAYCTATPIPRRLVAFAALTVPLLLTLEKFATNKAIRGLRSKGYGTRKTVILGTGSLGRQIFSTLARSPKFGLDPVGFVDDDPAQWCREIYECSYQRKSPVRVLAGPLSPELLSAVGATVLVIARQDLGQDSILRIVERFSAAGVTTYFIPPDWFTPGTRVEYANIDGIMLGHPSSDSKRVVYETGKRLLDVAVSGLLVVLLAPLLAVIALSVKLTSQGPVIFRQKRVGKNGQIFPMYKFRSMCADAPNYAYSPRDGLDPRITRVGRFLRRTSLDELPQIVNVLLGQMSLVGPRPEMPFIADGYSPLLRERLKVKPGITGLWQLSADRAFPIHDAVEYDLYYVRHRSLFMDVAILLHTLRFVSRGV